MARSGRADAARGGTVGSVAAATTHRRARTTRRATHHAWCPKVVVVPRSDVAGGHRLAARPVPRAHVTTVLPRTLTVDG